MVNKRGWLRIVEASVSVLIVFGVLLALSGIRQSTPERSLETFLPPLLEEVASNATLRGEIVQYDLTKTQNDPKNKAALRDIYTLLSKRITQSTLSYNLSICDPSVVCSLANYPTNVHGGMYTYERLITSNISSGYNPKKIKIFMWR